MTKTTNTNKTGRTMLYLVILPLFFIANTAVVIEYNLMPLILLLVASLYAWRVSFKQEQRFRETH